MQHNFKRTAMLILVSLVFMVGCEDPPKSREVSFSEVMTFIRGVDHFELLVISPVEANADGRKSSFHGFPILGRIDVPDATLRKRLLDTLDEAILAEKGNGAKCFAPRHGIRATKGTRTFDLLICFSCKHAYAYDDEKADVHDAIAGAHPNRSAQAVFDEVITRAGLKVPE